MPIEHLLSPPPESAPPPPRRRFRIGVFFAGLALVIVVVFLAVGGYVAYRAVRFAKTVGTNLQTLAGPARLLPYVTRDRDLLVLLMNNTELRPGGGFIGTVGIVRIRGGALAGFETHDVYALDRLGIGVITDPPPAPVGRYLGVKAWYLRDANWSPDFKVSSEQVLRAYRAEAALSGDTYPLDVDSVIGVTPTFLADLLRSIGPVTVSGTTFTPENVTDELEYQVERKFLENGTPREQRKEIIAEFAHALQGRLAALSPEMRTRVIAAGLRAFREKQLLAYDRDPAAQKVLESLGWAGRVKDAPDDYLLVADANLGSLKSDPAVARTVSYRIQPDGDAFTATVTITYQHTGHFDWKTTRYRTYTRVYAPAGSALLASSGALDNDKLKDPRQRPGIVDVGTELGKAAFGAFISIEPGQTRALSFTYRLPKNVSAAAAGGQYHLLVQKQPGTIGNGLTLDLGFGKKVQSAAPPEDQTEFGDERYRLATDLREDRAFEVLLK